jgi:hypothetical protein
MPLKGPEKLRGVGPAERRTAGRQRGTLEGIFFMGE